MLEQELRNRFPRAKLIGGDRDFGKLVAKVVAYVEAPAQGARPAARRARHGLPAAVWAALRDIPPGETATYGEIARRIGKPEAVRAVGTACGANRIAVAIPCHRVRGQRRQAHRLSLGRWQRKRALLDREKRKA